MFLGTKGMVCPGHLWSQTLAIPIMPFEDLVPIFSNTPNLQEILITYNKVMGIHSSCSTPKGGLWF